MTSKEKDHLFERLFDFPPPCTHPEHDVFDYCPYTPRERFEWEVAKIADENYQYGGSGPSVASFVTDLIAACAERRPTPANPTPQEEERE